MEDNLGVIYENDDFLVLEKPSGLTVNRSETVKDQETLQDLVEKKFKIDRGTDDLEYESRSGVVHRLDKETSGVILVAKNPQSFQNLKNQFKERKVKKTYLALAHGKLEGEGEIQVPVGRLPWNRKRFGVLAGGREAKTLYKALDVYQNGKEPLTLLELYPETGRTHQIRVHLKYINHPIFSDLLYAGRKIVREDRKKLQRLFLHANKISFTHPKKRELLSFESRLPDVLENFLKELKNP
jgi:23S rRNA pseudouridine1911/1915/1917 synthase